MKFSVDHDLHIHSSLSSCSKDPEQTPQRILQYAKDNNLRTICLTDHFWDEKVPGTSQWYEKQNFSHISLAKPLPQDENVRFLFGGETELREDLTLGVARETVDEMDFLLIPTTHMHFKFVLSQPETADRVTLWLQRLEAVLNMDLPFHKVGIAHLTCTLITKGDRPLYLQTLQALPEQELNRLFEKAARLGVGIEINSYDMRFSEEEADTVLRIYRIAKRCGCKFFCGSDAHKAESLDVVLPYMRRGAELLELTEDDKFII